MPKEKKLNEICKGLKVMNEFTINRRLPSLNDVIDQNRTNRFKGANFKKDIEEAIGWDIKQALTKGTLKPINEPCVVFIIWHEKTRRRDVDNIQSSQKFILDALVKNKVLPNDNRRYVTQVEHKVVDSDTDKVVVKLVCC